MTRPRSSLVSLETTPYYHCISRCVRRAFLCGVDRDGKCYDHRKQWIVNRLKYLAEIFAIDIAAYAVMSNHYHVVLHVDRARASAWTDAKVMQRWGQLYLGPESLQRRLRGDDISAVEEEQLQNMVQKWRIELSNISRFMACMNYVVALRANREDQCTGRFWEGRFKSQALKDEATLLACMAYVDLNPIRAGLAEELEFSEYTSIRDRILYLREGVDETAEVVRPSPALMPFSEGSAIDPPVARVPCGYRDYLELLDWQGRHTHPSKKGFIPAGKPRLLASLRLDEGQWLYLTREIGKEASTMLGALGLKKQAGQKAA